jgi:outer membrane protein assembly factor BamB
VKPSVPALVLLLTTTASAAAQDWPQFRGPTGQGLSSEQTAPVEWSETGNIRWKAPVAGRGWSSPVIAGDRVWLTTAVAQGGNASLRLVGLDFDSGREVVNLEVARIFRDEFSANPKNSDATPTPIVDGERVYVHFGAHATAAVSTEGTILWKTRLPHVNQHGQGGSPALVGDLLIINCDGYDESYIIALDARTGRTRWRRTRRLPTSQAYSTPLGIKTGESSQIISVGAFNTVALDPATGREIWRVTYRDGFSNVPRPVFAHGLVFVTTGFQQATLLAVRPDGAGDVTKTHVAWSTSRGVPLTSSPIVVGDLLFMVGDNGIATCLDARTGEPRWVERLGGNYSASPVAIAGRIYFANEDGVTTVIAAGAEFKVVARNALAGAMLASPAVARGSIVLRAATSNTASHVYRIHQP